MHPGEKGWVARGVRRSRRVAADGGGEPALHARVYRVDTSNRGRDLWLRAKREREHRADRATHPLEVGARADRELAVTADPGGDEGMRQLEQNGPAPTKHHDRLAVDAARKHIRKDSRVGVMRAAHLGVVVLLLAVAGPGIAAAQPAARPNVILVMADDLG